MITGALAAGVLGGAFLALRPSPASNTVAAGNPGASAGSLGGGIGAGASSASTSHPVPGSSGGAHGGVAPGVAQTPSPRDVSPAPPSELTGYRWPLTNARITNGYGKGAPGNFEVDGVTFHDGIDISSFCGARIVAAHDGKVLNAGRHHEAWLGWVGDLAPFRDRMERENGWGGQAITVVMDDGNGYRSVYAHLARKVVEAGDEVEAGDLLGYEGASGNATGCHLHYSIYSPTEVRTLALEKKTADKTLLPPLEIARIDPFLVLPPLDDGKITWGWGAKRE